MEKGSGGQRCKVAPSNTPRVITGRPVYLEFAGVYCSQDWLASEQSQVMFDAHYRARQVREYLRPFWGGLDGCKAVVEGWGS